MSEDPRKYQADEKCYRYFARLETWTREEAAALLLKLDPRIVLVPNGITHMRPADHWPQYCDLFEMIKRARTALPYDRKLKPQLVISWAKSVGLNPPQNLYDAVASAKPFGTADSEMFSEIDGIPNASPRAIASGVKQEAAIHHKAKSSLLRLVAGMAIRGYGYNPFQKQNKAVSDIESDLQVLNISLSDDTIRRWLTEACELIDWNTVAKDEKPRQS
ncbi:hypothetical protein [Hyphococcus sp.]|uniref:hypothetical protein n=1 Tax=Hyphococcus sp. TaxID=2038636 RepID=UPI0035C6A5DA